MLVQGLMRGLIENGRGSKLITMGLNKVKGTLTQMQDEWEQRMMFAL